ncbi:YbaB/EbfC family nucleoid-associated protein [Plantactinospora sp. DSM 117369]
MLERFHNVRDRLGEIQAEVAAADATAETADGLVRVTVAAGKISELWLDPAVYRRHEPRTLARLIVETIDRAQGAFNDLVNARYREVLGPGFDIRDIATTPGSEEAEERIRQTSRHLFGSG